MARPRLSRRKKLLFATIVTALAAALAYLVVLVVWSEQLYRYVTEGQRAVQGRLFAPDDELGYAVVPGARAESVFPIGPSEPIAIDGDGFRVPTGEAQAPAGAPELLALGCSFTFGAACAAEEAFPERVARARGLRARNAGGNGYGLVQMLRLARRHVPKRRPQVVLLQFSPWLVARSRSQMAPSYYGRLPVPYFAATDDESLSIRGPMFRTIVPNLPFSDYRGTGAGGRLSFYLRCGIPLFVHDHWHLALTRIERWPPPEADRRKIVRLCYRELAQMCGDVGARALVVVLGPSDPDSIAELERIDGLELVHAARALRRSVAGDDDEYERRYCHWRGDPPELVDEHPNARAHEAIAAAVLERLEAR